MRWSSRRPWTGASPAARAGSCCRRNMDRTDSSSVACGAAAEHRPGLAQQQEEQGISPPMATFTQRETLTEQIARHLGQQIITGRYKPGYKLRELEIARELEVSSNTVREAFHIVE